jgi:hypothetical protein
MNVFNKFSAFSLSPVYPDYASPLIWSFDIRINRKLKEKCPS